MKLLASVSSTTAFQVRQIKSACNLKTNTSCFKVHKWILLSTLRTNVLTNIYLNSTKKIFTHGK